MRFEIFSLKHVLFTVAVAVFAAAMAVMFFVFAGPAWAAVDFDRNDVAFSGKPAQSVVADVDGDGERDLLVVKQSDNAVGVRLGNGRGGFGAEGRFPVGDDGDGVIEGPLALALGDFDEDGNLDIVTANTTEDANVFRPDSVSILLGDGDGAFGTPTKFRVGDHPNTVAVADLDAAGNLDIVTSNAGSGGVSGDISALFGKGDGTFEAAVSLSAAPSGSEVRHTPQGVVVADFDGDGNLDLAAVSSFANTASVLLGDGMRGFGGAVSFGVGSLPTEIVADRL
ncbi:MAG: VCBS repeat-containing protein [Rubrobacter sp.]|nr:VCBS repeat-containing protein [Rubrobacter sp.]